MQSLNHLDTSKPTFVCFKLSSSFSFNTFLHQHLQVYLKDTKVSDCRKARCIPFGLIQTFTGTRLPASPESWGPLNPSRNILSLVYNHSLSCKTTAKPQFILEESALYLYITVIGAFTQQEHGIAACTQTVKSNGKRVSFCNCHAPIPSPAAAILAKNWKRNHLQKTVFCGNREIDEKFILGLIWSWRNKSILKDSGSS